MKSDYMNREGLVTLSYEETNLVRQALVLQAETLRAAIVATHFGLDATLSEHEMWHNMLERLYNFMTNAEVNHDAYREEMESEPVLEAPPTRSGPTLDEIEALQFIDLAEWERAYNGE